MYEFILAKNHCDAVNEINCSYTQSLQKIQTPLSRGMQSLQEENFVNSKLVFMLNNIPIYQQRQSVAL